MQVSPCLCQQTKIGMLPSAVREEDFEMGKAVIFYACVSNIRMMLVRYLCYERKNTKRRERKIFLPVSANASRMLPAAVGEEDFDRGNAGIILPVSANTGC
jgi:hypothetical protein